MAVPFIPHAFSPGNLDMEKLNDNLDASSRNIQRSLDARYTYSQLTFDLDGVLTADAQVLRELAIRRPGTNNAVEVVGLEVVLYGNVAGTATVTCSDATWPVLSITTSATPTVECSASSGVPVSVPSSSADVTFTLTLPAAYTVTRGYMVATLRCDRGNQGSSHAGYTPELFLSSTVIAADFDAELAAVAAAVARDTANATDLRCELVQCKNLVATGVVTVRLPSGAGRTLVGIQSYIVKAANNMSVSLTSSSMTTVAFNLSGTGAAARATSFTGPGADAVSDDDPMTAASDTIVSITSNTTTTLLGYLLIWWK